MPKPNAGRLSKFLDLFDHSLRVFSGGCDNAQPGETASTASGGYDPLMRPKQ